jgi:hypothetical protein
MISRFFERHLISRFFGDLILMDTSEMNDIVGFIFQVKSAYERLGSNICV